MDNELRKDRYWIFFIINILYSAMMTTRWDKPAVPLCEDDNPEILLKVEIYISLQIRIS